jgi:PTH1 family peptidyl-tRNA hydrolase
MKLIIGLGNIGQEYQNTRHNVGFLLIDHVVEEFDLPWQRKPKFQAEIAEGSLAGEKIIFAKPTTFYNASGQAAQAICNFYKVEPPEVLVIHDELALPFGTIRTRIGGSDAGNNGVKSISAALGPLYGRIRVGILSPEESHRDAAAFVLSKFSTEELQDLQTTIANHTLRFVEHFIHEDKKFEHTSIKP